MQGKWSLAGVVLAFASSVNAQTETTSVQLRTDESTPYCAFDRAVAHSHRVGERTLSGAFSVQCQPHARDYRLTTTLSPFAQLNAQDTPAYAVRWFVRQGGLACDGDVIHPDALPLHSGSRHAELVGQAGVKSWSYCIQLNPLASGYDSIDNWPLQGRLPLTLVDAAGFAPLPEDALRFHVNFDHNSSLLTDNATQLIDALMQSVNEPWRYHIQLHAHASLVGSESYNHDLTIMRLKRVREYLIERHGVRKKDTWGQAWGDSRPMALKTVEDEDTQNRRVDVVLISKKAAQLTP